MERGCKIAWSKAESGRTEKRGDKMFGEKEWEMACRWCEQPAATKGERHDI